MTSRATPGFPRGSPSGWCPYLYRSKTKMAEKLSVIPGTSIGPFRIGMTRGEIWDLTRRPITSFFKTPFSPFRTDDISLLGVHVHYEGTDELCSEIEAWTFVNHNKTELWVDGLPINGMKMGDIKAWLNEKNYRFESEDYGYSLSQLGIGFYCHNFEAEESIVDGLHIYKPRSNK